jgi:acylphosphatase
MSVPSQRTVHIRVEGRVQGVGFRAYVEMRARELGLRGWVRNRADGAVEAVFQGSDELVSRMLHYCREGPPASRVDHVETIGEPGGDFAGFSVRPTA